MAGFGSFAFGGAAFAGSGGPGVYTMTVGDSIGLGAAPITEQYRAIADALGLSAAAVSQPGIGVADSIRLVATAQASGLLLVALNENLAFQDLALQAWDVALSDAVQLVDSADGLRTLLQAVVDRLVLTDAAPTQIHAQAAVIAGFALAALANPAFDATVADSVDFAGSAQAIAAMVAVLGDTLTVSDAAAGAARVLVALDDSLAADAIAATQLTAVQAVWDALQVGITIRLGDAEYYAWVLHPQAVDRAGTRPVTEYRNFPFNSFANHDGVEYGAGVGGIYELTGGDDDGAPIEAWMRAGLSNFGTDAAKRLPEMFLAVRSDEDECLFLKVIHNDAKTGRRTEDWYRFDEVRASGMTRETRAKIAQGLKSVFWGYELHNINGADFGLNEARLYPLILDGKVT
jgi:hypothetical protein